MNFWTFSSNQILEYNRNAGITVKLYHIGIQVRVALNFLPIKKQRVENRTPQTKLARMFTMKMPKAFPSRNPIPITPFAINSNFMARSDFSDNAGAAHSREIPMNPYPSSANVQKNEYELGVTNCQSPVNSLFKAPVAQRLVEFSSEG